MSSQPQPQAQERAEVGHTPGPWGVITDHQGCKSIYQLGVGEDGGIFAITEIGYTHGRADEAEDEANTRLICAAPDLLAAAEKVLAGLEARIEAAPPNAVPVFDGIAELHDAINKARDHSRPSHPRPQRGRRVFPPEPARQGT